MDDVSRPPHSLVGSWPFATYCTAAGRCADEVIAKRRRDLEVQERDGDDNEPHVAASNPWHRC
jgi:hypothetical protein